MGMIVAETEAIARKAAKAVKITYKNLKEPILVSKLSFMEQWRVIYFNKHLGAVFHVKQEKSIF